MENQLIHLYLRVCHTYDTCSQACFQRLSNNATPAFTDQELITIFFFGHLNGLFQKKAIYRLIVNYWRQWFPHLPSYQTFCYRLNLLAQTFQALGGTWLGRLQAEMVPELDRLIDSFPVMLAKHGHAYQAKVGREIANKGYCAAKKTHFHGVRLHTIAQRRNGHLPLPDRIWLRAASVHDLASVREQDIHLPTSTLFGDKAFRDQRLEQLLTAQATRLYTPHKKPKGSELSETQKAFNRMVNRLRQPIESFFNWLNEKTQIQNASKVRSTESLLVQCWGKLAFAMLSLVFNY
ncbi:MAG: IS982 family transposase [Acidobacteriota bacterium]|nr:IS982 family transposase [Acidobacteriota bacterium]MDQ3586514.1 IS982 family transposase [Acidobacteriota bacterium]